MMTSIFVVGGSVNRRNFVPVSVWKQVRRNRSVSRTSIPVFGREGLGRVQALEGAVVDVDVPAVVPMLGAVDAAEAGIWGVRERVIAWTLLEQWTDRQPFRASS